MKKTLILATLLTIVLAFFTLTKTYTRNNYLDKGWPVPYQHGPTVCGDGNLSLVFCENPTHDYTYSTNNYAYIAADTGLCALVGLALAYGVSRLNEKK